MKIKLGQLRQIIREEIARSQSGVISEMQRSVFAQALIDAGIAPEDIGTFATYSSAELRKGPRPQDAGTFSKYDPAQIEKVAVAKDANVAAVSNDMLQSRSRLSRRYSDTSGT